MLHAYIRSHYDHDTVSQYLQFLTRIFIGVTTVQTFLPYPSFEKSAACLDYRRLGKQRVEALQILNCLQGEGSNGWKHHPAVKMWKGHEYSLCLYGMAICLEWKRRGYKDSLLTFFYSKNTDTDPLCSLFHPKWMGNTEFHTSHQSNLLRKLPSHYSKHFPDVPNDLPYVWPV